MSLRKRLFGPGQNEVWRELSDRLGGEFIPGGFFKGASRVEARVADSIATLDTYTVSTGKSSVTFTRMRAPFLNPGGFRFTIYRKSMFSALGKLFGMQDVGVGGPTYEKLEPLFGVPGYLDPQIIESGEPDFDGDFIIKGNDEARVRTLFKQFRIRELVKCQPAIHLQVKAGDGDGVDELYFQVTGVIKDLERLTSLFELYREVLVELRAAARYETTNLSGG